MFDFKTMGAIASLLKDPGKLRDTRDRIRTRVEEVRAAAESGGGAVRVWVSGTLKVESIELSPAITSAGPDGAQMAGALIAEAVNTATDIAKDRVRVILEEEASALGFTKIPEEITGLLR